MLLSFLLVTLAAGRRRRQFSKGENVQLTLRPYVTAGISIVGAAVIAVSPISPVTPDMHMPAIHASSAAVELTGVVNPIGDPISAWANVVMNAFENTVALGGQVLDHGTPVLSQVLANQMGYANMVGTTVKNVILGFYYWQGNSQWMLDYANDQLKAGQVGDWISYNTYAVMNIAFALFPMLDLLKLPGLIGQNLINVVEAVPEIAKSLGSSTLMLQAPIHAFARQVQGLVDSVNAGDPLSALNAVLNIPAAMTGAFFDAALYKYTNWMATGIAGALLIGIGDIIANAIKPPSPPVVPAIVESAPDTLVADASSISSTAILAADAPGTVTVSLDPKPAAPETPATETPATETPVDETPVDETPVDETPVDEAPVDETPVDSEPSVDDDTDDNSPSTGSDENSTDASKDDADRVSENEAKAEKRDAKSSESANANDNNSTNDNDSGSDE